MSHAPVRRLRPSLAPVFGFLAGLGALVLQAVGARIAWENDFRATWSPYETLLMMLPTGVSMLLGWRLGYRERTGRPVDWLELVASTPLLCSAAAFVVFLFTPDLDFEVVVFGTLFVGCLGFLSLLLFGLPFHFWLRLGRHRERGILDDYDRRGWHRATAITTAIAALAWSVVASRREPGEAWAGWYVLVVSAVAVGWLALRDFLAARRLAACAKRSVEHEVASFGVDFDEAGALDVGRGDARWVLDRPPAHPHRAVSSLRVVAIGDLVGARRALLSSAAVGGGIAVCLVVVTAMLGAELQKPPSPAYDVPVAQAPPVTACDYGAWYGAQAPIAVDINGDGIEDVIGLRWAAGRDPALALGAVDGNTLRPLWCTPHIPSQSNSPHIRLLLSGSTVFLFDSEGWLRAYAASDGRQLAEPVRVPIVEAACADEPGSVWFRGAGTEDPRGRCWDASPDSRPSVCTSRCDPPSGSPCDAAMLPRVAIDGQADGELRVFAEVDGPTPGAANAGLVAVDTTTCDVRWSVSWSLDEVPLHRWPDAQAVVSGERVVIRYQARDGTWRLGARERATGERLWVDTVRGVGLTHRGGALTVSSQAIYAAFGDGLVVYDPVRGVERASLRF